MFWSARYHDDARPEPQEDAFVAVVVLFVIALTLVMGLAVLLVMAA